LIFLACAFSCKKSKNAPNNILYDIDSPSHSIKLPKELNEISGLSYIGPNLLLGVQDEKGKAYAINSQDGKIVNSTHFNSDGDYEGVTQVGQQAYVLKSNGNLYSFHFSQEDKKIKSLKIESPLNEDFDAEGLCLDSTNNRLLIACKGIAGKSDKYSNQKAVYAFDLNSKEFSSEPIFLISIEDLRSPALGEGLLEFFGRDNLTLNPSGIAIHPITKEIYILSARGNIMVILSARGDILAVQPLNSRIFKQAEGICFGPKGTMFISNEGRAGRANIKVFNYKK